MNVDVYIMQQAKFYLDNYWIKRKFAQMINKKRIMATTLNEAQLQILDMMSFIKSEETYNDLNKVISDFFALQAQNEIDRLWENGELNETKVEGVRKLHERTPYK